MRVAGVTATGNGTFGIRVEDSPDAWVNGNTASGNGYVGILVWDSPRSRVTGNTASRNGVYGIAADNCDGCEITGNRTDGNGQVEGEGQGITLFDTTGALVARNTSTGNGQAGIRVLEGSTDNRLEGNQATGNGVDLVDENLPACVNTWRANRFATDNEGDGPGAGCIR